MNSLPLLSTITDPIKVSDLKQPQLRELQQALAQLGYPVGEIDGFYGRRTATAWSEFKEDEYQGDPELIGPGSVALLKVRLPKSGGRIHDFSTKEGTVEAIKWECDQHGIGLAHQKAYVLATVEHETAGTFRPIAEYGKGKGRSYGNPDPVTGRVYYGRGYVQLTWKRNYEKYSRILGVDLVSNPDKVMEPNLALFILVHGFKTGAFTGRRITDYINRERVDYRNARRCINGMDRADDIADLARKWETRIIKNI